jgi:hypothetical protein
LFSKPTAKRFEFFLWPKSLKIYVNIYVNT